MKNIKLFAGVAAVTVTLLAGCTGNVPGQLGQPGQPGFSGRITKNNQGLPDRQVWLKRFSSGTEGTLTGGVAVEGTRVKTDSNGNYFIPAPADAVTAGALFGIGYDVANSSQGGDTTKLDAKNLTDEIQWFSSPAYNLSTKSGNTVNVSFDVAWAISGFSPAYGSTVQATNKTVTFTLPPKTGATEYEVTVNSGTAAGAGSLVAGAGNTPTLKGPNPTLTWPTAANGPYTYQAKAHMPNGVAGVSGNSQMASPWLVFTVAGAQ